MADKTTSAPPEQAPAVNGGLLFRMIAKHPLIFCIVLPVVLIVVTAVGFTREDYVEDSVGEIWIPRSDLLVKNTEYMESVGVEDFSSSSFAAMALSRDSENLFTESRLEEIRARMDAIEALTIDYNGETFTWKDVCALNSLGAGTGTTYRFPCARLSPMDLFQETRSYFGPVDRLTWYHGVVKGAAIRPRVLRFGAMSQFCLPTEEAPDQTACAYQAGLRTNPEFAVSQGYQPEYANPLGLIGDVGSLELNDPCRICIEESLEAGIDQLQNGLIVPFFTVLAIEFRRYQATLTDPTEQAQIEDLTAKAEKIAANLDRKSVEDFYYYQVVKSTYASLGAAQYQNNYNNNLAPNLPLDSLDCEKISCPALNVSLDEAKQALLNHADAAFSSVTTPGSPLPLWSESDGTGVMFGGSNPVGGSGIDMSQDILSGAYYLDLQHFGQDTWSPVYTSSGFANPSDPIFQSLVEVNPVYAWYMAGETNMTASCGNGTLTGAGTEDAFVNGLTAGVANLVTQYWCTPFNVPFEEDATYTKQHFARMWYDLLLDSDSFLGVTQGSDDPYTFTLGAGCGYSLGGERDPYTGKSDVDILGNASRDSLYFIDEGASVGVIDRNLLIGDATPGVGEYSYSNPLQKVGVIQSLYASHGTAEGIVNRVKNCNRPGGPIDITEDEALEILGEIKVEFDNIWSKGWDDENDGEVQFVSFSDDVGAVGTTGNFLLEITLSNGTLTAISIVVIAAFSIFLMFSLDPVQSKVALTLVGVALVILSYFAAIGLSIIIGIKINVATAYTLPFILLGLGVDDMYIVLLALKKEGGYTEGHFVRAMKEVVVPVSMTSLVNASMFAIMNISDVPAVYLTARVALIAVCFLYLSIIFCFSAYCFLDMRRQEAGKRDVFCCVDAKEKDEHDTGNKCVGTWLSSLLYDRFFRPFILKASPVGKLFSHGLLWAIGGLLFAFAVWGITQREVGLGLEDFFPSTHQAHTWASKRTESLSSWSIGMNWGALDYGNPDTQMKMIKQFEDVIDHENIAEVDTSQLWIAKLNVWTTRQCDSNVARPNPDMLRCGRDQIWSVDNSTCAGTWKNNTYSLREKVFDDGKGTCQAFKGGICRPTNQMHPSDLDDLGVNASDVADTVWCPVFEDWSDEKLGFCLKQWRFHTGGGGGLLVLSPHGSPTQCAGEYYNDEEVQVPIPYSKGPTMFSFDLFTHEITTDVIEETRAVCDYHDELHCWLTGIPYNYWSQYVGIFDVLLEIAGSSIAVGFAVSVVFLLAKLSSEGNHSAGKIIGGSLMGALLITTVMILSLVSVVGLSILAGVNLTGFSIMSFVLSVGFSVEYAVHVVSRWIHAPMSIESATDRVDYAMSFLTLPTFMSFVSSTIGVLCLAGTEFEFTQVFYFRPLIIVMPVTYFYGCWWLPAFLTLLDFDCVKLGEESEGNPDVENKETPEIAAQSEATHTQTEKHGGSDSENEKRLSEIAEMNQESC